MESNFPEKLSEIDEETLISLQEQAKDYAVYKGILMRKADLPKDAAVTLPFCLFPSKFPEKWFKLACELQPYMNLVIFKAALSKEFLKECLASAIESDEFTANIFKIYETVNEENQGNEQLCLGLIRTDYLLDCDSTGNVTGIKQVESNTISASFGGMAPGIRDLHEFVLTKLGVKDCAAKLPPNNSVDALAAGLVAAWEAYDNPNAAILFVLEEVTLNVYDQRALEYAVLKINSDIEVVRYTFQELGHWAKLKNNNILWIKDKIEVAVVYYRTGYTPEQYAAEDWKTRLLMERSKAIKCPSAGLHLAGTKRVQLQLTKPGVLEKFVHPNVAEKLRDVFARQYNLNMNEEGDQAFSLGIKNPEKYVMKPEREGGGNNLYGADLKSMLESIKSSKKREAYILMELIQPPSVPNCIVLSNKTSTVQDVKNELGIFGVILKSQKCMIVNKFAGHLVRSKWSYSNETGIVAGFGALDSPYLDV